jgi:hypothetical protein
MYVHTCVYMYMYVCMCSTRITCPGTLNVHVPRHMTMTIHMIHMNARMNSLHLAGLFYTHDGTCACWDHP